jgi:redox-sensitive bicupin YhaK (pirin superfamily)
MQELHYAKDRGTTEARWLHSRHSFSFNEYYNPHRMGFGALVVLNDDDIEPGEGFSPHAHTDMEIVTIVLEGELSHRDSAGHSGVIKAGDVQHMSAGTGITHMEYNHSQERHVSLLQIWIEPKERGIKPSYEQRTAELRENALVPLVTGDGREGSLRMHQDAAILRTEIGEGKSVSYDPEHSAFIFVISGIVDAGGKALSDRDALAITGTKRIEIKATKAADVLVIDVPKA